MGGSGRHLPQRRTASLCGGARAIEHDTTAPVAGHRQRGGTTGKHRQGSGGRHCLVTICCYNSRERHYRDH
ncbi:unnamed protein product [Urochloa humidicola]